jgi:hypothetical protein
MESKAFFILLKFLQSINIKKKQHEYKPYILMINLILKINIIVNENSSNDFQYYY